MGAIDTRQATANTPGAVVAQIRAPEFREQVQMALPADVSPDRFTRVAVTALLQAPDLVNADRSSLFQSLIQCAQIGLMPDGRQAALVVFNTKVKTDQGDKWIKKVQALPMIGGYRHIAAEHGWSLQTRAVYENDQFDHVLGLTENLVHVPTRPGAERGRLVAAYAVAKHRDGREPLFEVIYKDDADRAKKASRAAERGPWVDSEARMWEKTAGKRLFLKLPLADSDRVERILAADAEDATPAQAAAALYGPSAGDAFADQPPPADSPAGEPTPSPSPQGERSPADDDEPYVAIEGEVVNDPPAPDLVAAAGQMVVPAVNGRRNPMSGQTLAAILAQGDDGTRWLRWATEPARPWNKPAADDDLILFGEAVRLFVAHHLPAEEQS